MPNIYIMKRPLVPTLLVLALVCQLPAHAELFRPATVKGALVGGVAGAIIGHNNDRRGWEGAAYGMAAGAIVGSIVGDARTHDHRAHRHRWHSHDRYRYYNAHPSVRWHVGVGHYHRYPTRWRHHDRWVHRRHFDHGPSWAWHVGSYHRGPWVVRRHAPVHHHVPHVSYRARGAFWGGLAGAVIGHNHGRRGWEGAAYGLAGGYLLGSLADARVQQRLADAEAAEAWARAAERSNATPAPAPTNITINNYYAAPAPASPMAAANRAFGR